MGSCAINTSPKAGLLSIARLTPIMVTVVVVSLTVAVSPAAMAAVTGISTPAAPARARAIAPHRNRGGEGKRGILLHVGEHEPILLPALG